MPKEGSNRVEDGCSRDFLRIPRRLLSTAEDNRQTTFNRFHEIVLREIKQTSGMTEPRPIRRSSATSFADRGELDFTDLPTSTDPVRVETNVGESTLVKASPLKTNAFGGSGGTRSDGFSLGREYSSFGEGARRFDDFGTFGYDGDKFERRISRLRTANTSTLGWGIRRGKRATAKDRERGQVRVFSGD